MKAEAEGGEEVQRGGVGGREREREQSGVRDRS